MDRTIVLVEVQRYAHLVGMAPANRIRIRYDSIA